MSKKSTSRGKGRGLQKSLEGTNYSGLIEMIDWSAVPNRSLIVAFFWVAAAAFGVPLLILAGLLLVDGFLYSANYEWALVLSSPIFATLFLLFFVLLPLAISFNVFGACVAKAKHELAKFPELALFDIRRPNLYFRRFAGEIEPLGWQRNRPRMSMILWVIGFLLAGWLYFLIKTLIGLALSSRDKSFENLLAKSVSSKGPLLCLSDPKRRSGGGEAMRLPIRAEVWQDAVSRLLDEANIVAVRYVSGDHLSWEAERALSGQRHPLLIWVPNLPRGWREVQTTDHEGPKWMTTGYSVTLSPWIRDLLAKAEPIPEPENNDTSLVVLALPNGEVKAKRCEPSWGGVQSAMEVAVLGAKLPKTRNPHSTEDKTGLLKLAWLLIHAAPVCALALASTFLVMWWTATGLFAPYY